MDRKLQVGKFPLVKQEKPPTVRFTSCCRTWETGASPKFNARHALDAEVSRAYPKYTKRHEGGQKYRVKPKTRRNRDIKIILFFRGVKKEDFEGLLWGPVTQEVLLKAILTGPMALSENVRPFVEAQIRL